MDAPTPHPRDPSPTPTPTPPAPPAPRTDTTDRTGPTRYRLTLSYDGTDFCGWQRQVTGRSPLDESDEETTLIGPDAPATPPSATGTPGESETTAPIELRTVQGVLQRAVREVVREPVVVFGASRTDSGVHARGQVAAFTTGWTTTPDGRGGRVRAGWPPERGTEPLLRAINSRLPDDVLVRSVEIVPLGFNPIGDCVSKGYTYTLHVSRDRPLWDRNYVHHVWTPLDIARMRDAAAVLVGEHDFAAFAAAGHGRLSTVRTVFECEVRDESASRPAHLSGREHPEQRIVIAVSGSGFLWHMVRIIAGTLFEAGRGRLSTDHVRDALATGDRRKAGPTLPARGLCLEWIRYKNNA